ncbi:hypothetical protein DENSPDRAFT_858370 [Dentipellis sp. KUC8613]|nr:hypothetical protein DENSPDRAFT_858370 [Dentipellis sp. KUC8613]
MSRLPPALLYLTIYNPTLRPSGPVAPDDEDAEEEAHILFYTARERAVSRDTMLRQVGLAKALGSFSEIFAQGAPCDNVHGQTRRMLMLAPEPDFWIHACVELAKTPRRAVSKKGKGREREKGRGKEKEKDAAKGGDKGKAKAKTPEEVVYDYHDGSVQDASLRSQIMRGYEQFKLIHGSFTSILHTLGQQALELQLERFFTVWAWKWDIEEDSDFGSHLGLSLHPLYKTLTPLLDEFTAQIPSTASPRAFALLPPHIVPSTSFTTPTDADADAVLPALPLYLLSRIPPPRPPSPPPPPPSASEPEIPRHDDAPGFNGEMRHVLSASGSALVALGSAVDVRKWSWPGYLTLPKGLVSKPATPDSLAQAPSGSEKGNGAEPAAESEQAGEGDGDGLPRLALPSDGGSVSMPLPEPVQVDRESLFEAMSSVSVNAISDDVRRAEDEADVEAESSERASREAADDADDADLHIPEGVPGGVGGENGDGDEDGDGDRDGEEGLMTAKPDPAPPQLSAVNVGASPLLLPRPALSRASSFSVTAPAPAPAPAPVPPLPTFAPLSIYTAPRADPLATERRKVLYLFNDQQALAFVARADGEYSEDEMRRMREAAAALFAKLAEKLEEDRAERSRAPDMLAHSQSATKILQPKDTYVIDTGRGTALASAGFASRSEHLYTGQQLISAPDGDVLEVFSRTQGAQHWFIARREAEGAVYMEVGRKETTLTDVDNELEVLMRRYADTDQV